MTTCTWEEGGNFLKNFWFVGELPSPPKGLGVNTEYVLMAFSIMKIGIIVL